MCCQDVLSGSRCIHPNEPCSLPASSPNGEDKGSVGFLAHPRSHRGPGAGDPSHPTACMHVAANNQMTDREEAGRELERRKGGDFLTRPRRQFVKLDFFPVLDSPPPSLPAPPPHSPRVLAACHSFSTLPFWEGKTRPSLLLPHRYPLLSSQGCHPTECGQTWMLDSSSLHPSPKTVKLATNTHQIAPGHGKV